MSGTIDTVVFDIGKVLIDWDPRNLYRRIFPDAERMEWFLTHVCSSAWNERQDAGRPWAEAEAELIERFPGLAAEIRAYRARWIEMVPGAIEGMPELFDAVGAAGYRRAAVSNFAADTFLEAAERFPMLGAFDGAAISGRLGLLKPDPAIFHWLIENHGIEPTRAVYVDDLPGNIATAQALGFRAHLFEGAAGFLAFLRQAGLAVDERAAA